MKFKQKKSRRSLSLKVLIYLIFCIIASLYAITIQKLIAKRDNNDNTHSQSSPVNQNRRPPKCTPAQRSRMLQQLTPDRCNENYSSWHQKCSFTKATKCPDSTWLDSHYESIHSKKKRIIPEFVAVYVGCNKGYDAVNALRMGTRNRKYSKITWANQLKESFGSVCNQNEANEFQIGESSGAELDGTVHCIEPVKATADRLKDSAKTLGWDSEFLVTEAAISKDVGVQYFQGASEVGIENRGFDDCGVMKEKYPEDFKKLCVEVPLYSLDYYMENVSKKYHHGRIHLLSIDVEGYDFDVLLGATQTLSGTEYLEFEYNWMGSWAKQNLLDAVKMLDGIGFTCYWAGSGKAWRIDESCWLDHFSWHAWSNVACVNRLINAQIAVNMEDTFIKTLREELTY